VALVHGFVGNGLSTWSHQVEALSDEHTVVAWDAPGAGHSSRPPEWFRLADYADCFTAFLGALGFPRAHLVGLSFGGALVLEAFARHPTVPQSLGLVSAYAGWAGSLTPEETEQRLQFCLDLAERPAHDFLLAMMPSMFSTSAPADAVARFAESVIAFDPAGFKVMAVSAAQADLRSVLPTVDVPTLLLYGDKDVRAPLQVGRAIAASIPGSRLVVLPGVGHASPVEAPESVSREIRDFLRDSSPVG
jgi:pimeloyl-ACP methyl ester carboxylesterase